MERAEFEQWKSRDVARVLSLAESGRRYYQDLLTSLPVPVAVITEGGALSAANPAFCAMLGIAPASLAGKTIDSLIPSADLTKRAAEVRNTGQLQHRIAIEFGGAGRTVSLFRAGPPDEGEIGLVFEHGAPPVPEPVRPAKEDSRVRGARADAVRRLAARLAHDLNNPLMILTGYGEELQAAFGENQPHSAELAEMLAASRRIVALAEGLLAFTRKQAREARPVDLAAAAGAAAARLRKPGLLIEVNAPAAVEVLADPEQLEEALVAFAGAATGWTRLEISAGPGPRAVFRSNAPALSSDDRAALFESFLPGKPGAEPSAGPALARAYAMIREWGGDVEASGEPMEIVVTLRSAVPETAPAGAATVLLVDDEDRIRDLLRRILEREGYRVLEAPSAGEAVRIAEGAKTGVSLLLTDVQLGGQSGRDVAAALERRHPGLRVVYMSGHTGDIELPRGAVLLSKPFTSAVLVETVRRALSGSGN